jgi:cytochrome c biogenesis protein CcdA
MFLPDPDKPSKKEISPEEHVTANLALSVMTIAAAFTLSFLVFFILGFQPGTHPLIYATGGVLIAMGAWHIQSLWRSLMLRKHFKKVRKPAEITTAEEKLLDPARFESIVPESVTERTTRQLSRTKR